MRWLAAVLITITGFLSSTAHAQGLGYCPMDSNETVWQAQENIPVYLNTTVPFIDTTVSPPQAVPVTDVEFYLRVVLNEMQENSDYTRVLYYAGRTTSPGKSNAIVITPDPQRLENSGYALPADFNDDGYYDSCTVEFGQESGQFGYLLIHEMMHCLGIHHPYVCGPDEPSLLSRQLERKRWDEYSLEALEEAYGQRVSTALGWTLTNAGTTWTPLSYGGPFSVARGPVSACNSATLNGSQVVFATDFSQRVRRWDPRGTTIADILESDSLTSPGVACGPGSKYLVAYVDQRPSTDLPRHRAYTWTGSTGSTQDLLVGDNGFNDGDSISDQVRATYDPATGNYVVATRDPWAYGDRVRIQVVGGAWVIMPFDAFGTPNIACGAPSVVGADNCVVTWTHNDWQPTLRWIQGRIDPSTNRFVYNPANLMAQGMYTYGGAGLAYSGDPTYPWLLVFHQNGGYLHAYRKSANTTAGWSYASTVLVDSTAQLTAPAILSYATKKPLCAPCPIEYHVKVFVKATL